MPATAPTIDDLNTTAVPVFGKLTGLRARRKWLEARKQGIGSSDIGAILGLSTYGSAFSVYYTKLPEWDETWEQSEEQEHGLRSEKQLAAKIGEQLPEWRIIVPPAAMWAHPEYPWMLCSPDRLAVHKTTGEVRPVELKTDQNSGRWTLDAPPGVYRVQLGWQAMVFGADRGFMCAEVNHRYLIYDLGFPADEQAGWRHAGSEFWEQVVNGEAPDIDGHPATRDALRKLYPDFDEDADPVPVADALAAEYDDADVAAKAAEKRLLAAKNALLAHIGNGVKAIDSEGRTVAYRIRFDKPGYTVGPSTQTQLRAGVARRRKKEGK